MPLYLSNDFYFCTLCNVYFSKLSQYEQHITTAQHQYSWKQDNITYFLPIDAPPHNNMKKLKTQNPFHYDHFLCQYFEAGSDGLSVLDKHILNRTTPEWFHFVDPEKHGIALTVYQKDYYSPVDPPQEKRVRFDLPDMLEQACRITPKKDLQEMANLFFQGKKYTTKAELQQAQRKFLEDTMSKPHFDYVFNGRTYKTHEAMRQAQEAFLQKIQKVDETPTKLTNRNTDISKKYITFADLHPKEREQLELAQQKGFPMSYNVTYNRIGRTVDGVVIADYLWPKVMQAAVENATIMSFRNYISKNNKPYIAHDEVMERIMTVIKDRKTKGVYCELCEIYMDTIDEFKRHAAGKKHMRLFHDLPADRTQWPHRKVHVRQDTIHCEHCAFTTSTQESYIKHLRSNHTRLINHVQTKGCDGVGTSFPLDSRTRYICTFCDFRTTNYSHLEVHNNTPSHLEKATHSFIHTYTCLTCRFQTIINTEYEDHLRTPLHLGNMDQLRAKLQRDRLRDMEENGKEYELINECELKAMLSCDWNCDTPEPSQGYPNMENHMFNGLEKAVKKGGADTIEKLEQTITKSSNIFNKEMEATGIKVAQRFGSEMTASMTNAIDVSKAHYALLIDDSISKINQLLTSQVFERILCTMEKSANVADRVASGVEKINACITSTTGETMLTIYQIGSFMYLAIKCLTSDLSWKEKSLEFGSIIGLVSTTNLAKDTVSNVIIPFLRTISNYCTGTVIRFGEHESEYDRMENEVFEDFIPTILPQSFINDFCEGVLKMMSFPANLFKEFVQGEWFKISRILEAIVKGFKNITTIVEWILETISKFAKFILQKMSATPIIDIQQQNKNVVDSMSIIDTLCTVDSVLNSEALAAEVRSLHEQWTFITSYIRNIVHSGNATPIIQELNKSQHQITLRYKDYFEAAKVRQDQGGRRVPPSYFLWIGPPGSGKSNYLPLYSRIKMCEKLGYNYSEDMVISKKAPWTFFDDYNPEKHLFVQFDDPTAVKNEVNIKKFSDLHFVLSCGDPCEVERAWQQKGSQERFIFLRPTLYDITANNFFTESYQKYYETLSAIGRRDKNVVYVCPKEDCVDNFDVIKRTDIFCRVGVEAAPEVQWKPLEELKRLGYTGKGDPRMYHYQLISVQFGGQQPQINWHKSIKADKIIDINLAFGTNLNGSISFEYLNEIRWQLYKEAEEDFLARSRDIKKIEDSYLLFKSIEPVREFVERERQTSSHNGTIISFKADLDAARDYMMQVIRNPKIIYDEVTKQNPAIQEIQKAIRNIYVQDEESPYTVFMANFARLQGFIKAPLHVLKNFIAHDQAITIDDYQCNFCDKKFTWTIDRDDHLVDEHLTQLNKYELARLQGDRKKHAAAKREALAIQDEEMPYEWYGNKHPDSPKGEYDDMETEILKKIKTSDDDLESWHSFNDADEESAKCYWTNKNKVYRGINTFLGELRAKIRRGEYSWRDWIDYWLKVYPHLPSVRRLLENHYNQEDILQLKATYNRNISEYHRMTKRNFPNYKKRRAIELRAKDELVKRETVVNVDQVAHSSRMINEIDDDSEEISLPEDTLSLDGDINWSDADDNLRNFTPFKAAQAFEQARSKQNTLRTSTPPLLNNDPSFKDYFSYKDFARRKLAHNALITITKNRVEKLIAPFAALRQEYSWVQWAAGIAAAIAAAGGLISIGWIIFAKYKNRASVTEVIDHSWTYDEKGNRVWRSTKYGDGYDEQYHGRGRMPEEVRHARIAETQDIFAAHWNETTSMTNNHKMDVIRRIQQNVGLISIKTGEGKVSSRAQVLFLDNEHLWMNLHTWTTIVKYDYFTIQIMNVEQDYDTKSVRAIWCSGKDLCVVRLPRCIEGVQKVVNLFMPRNQLMAITPQRVARISTSIHDKCMMHLDEANFVERFTNKGLVTQNFNYTNNWGFTYDSTSSGGNSGGPIIVTDNNNVRFIGIHLGSLYGQPGYAMASFVSKEDLEVAMTKLNLKDFQQLVFKPSTKVLNEAERIHHCDLTNEAFEPPHNITIEHIIEGPKVPVESTDTRFNVVATVEPRKGTHIPLKSDFIHSPLYGYKENTLKPAPLKCFVNKEGELVNPGRKGQEKYLRKNAKKLPSKQVMQEAVEDIVQTLLSYDSPYKNMGELTLDQAINGIPGDKYITPIPRDTSVGYPMIINPETNSRMKLFDINNYGTLTPRKNLVDRINDVYECVLNGKQYVFAWMDITKDELIDAEKADSGKVRWFQVAPINWTIVFRQFFLTFGAHVMWNHVNGECNVGINPHSAEWGMFAKRLLRHGNNWIAGDYEAFDKSMEADYLELVFRVVELFHKLMMNKWRNTAAYWVYKSLLEHWHIVGRTIIKHILAHCSGDPLTAVINSIIGMIYLRVAYVALTKRPMSQFRKDVEAGNYGDDHAASVANEIKHQYNQITLHHYFKSINIGYTDARTKKPPTEPFTSPDEVTYLCRGFRACSQTGWIYAPRNLEDIRSSIQWMRKNTLQRETFASQLESATLDLYHHGRDVYNAEVTDIINHLCKMRWSVPFLPTYDFHDHRIRLRNQFEMVYNGITYNQYLETLRINPEKMGVTLVDNQMGRTGRFFVRSFTGPIGYYIADKYFLTPDPRNLPEPWYCNPIKNIENYVRSL